MIQSLPYDLTSLVQRFGRAARGPGIQGVAILLAPPNTSEKYKKRCDVLKFVMATTEKKCRWEVVDRYLGNDLHLRNNCCDVCLGDSSRRQKIDLIDHIGPVVVVPRGKSTDKEQAVGRKRLLEWRKMEYDNYRAKVEPLVDLEYCFLPEKPLAKLCSKLFAATTPEMVRAIAGICNWQPMEPEHYAGIARVVEEALFEIKSSPDDRHASVVEE
jgi:hypothetical protein